MSVRVRFPSEAHDPSWKLFLEGFLFLCHISARQIRTFEQKKVWQRKEQKLSLSKQHKAIQEFNLNISHFTGQGWNTGLKFKPFEAKPIENILVINSNYQSYKLKRRLIQEGFKENICERCKLSEWQGLPIPLELHHKNGNNRDNRLENIVLLYPNCHALTESYRGKNKRQG